MKALFAILALTFAHNAHAATLVCALKEAKKPSNYSSVTVDLSKTLQDAYNSDGVDVGDDDNYSFILTVTRDGKKLEVSSIFTENKHVQDEVSSGSWTVNPAKAKAGKPVITEPLTEDGKKILDFVCYYNK